MPYERYIFIILTFYCSLQFKYGKFSSTNHMHVIISSICDYLPVRHSTILRVYLNEDPCQYLMAFLMVIFHTHAHLNPPFVPIICSLALITAGESIQHCSWQLCILKPWWHGTARRSHSSSFWQVTNIS